MNDQGCEGREVGKTADEEGNKRSVQTKNGGEGLKVECKEREEKKKRQ